MEGADNNGLCFPIFFWPILIAFYFFFYLFGSWYTDTEGIYCTTGKKKKDERESSAHRRIAASLERGLKGQTKQSKRRKKGDIIR